MKTRMWASLAVASLGLAAWPATQAEADTLSGRDREAYYRERAAAWARAGRVEPMEPARQPSTAVVRRQRAAPAPALNLPRPRAGTGELQDSGRVGSTPRGDLNHRGPGLGTLNGLGNANGGTGIGGGSTGTGVDSGTNAGADLVRPLPAVGDPEARASER